MEDPSGTTHGAQWSTPVADYLDDIYARDAAEEAEAAEKLRLKEERQAQRRRKLQRRDGATRSSSADKNAEAESNRHESRSGRMPEAHENPTILVGDRDGHRDDSQIIPLWDERAEFARELGGNCDGGIGAAVALAPETPYTTAVALNVGSDPDVIHTRSSKRRRLDVVTPTHTVSEPQTEVLPPPVLAPDCSPSSPSATAGPAKACQNCGATSSPRGACTFRSSLTAGQRICQPCYLYERKHQKYRPPELEVRRQSRIRGDDLECMNCGTTKSTGNWGYSKADVGARLCYNCFIYERRHNKPRPCSVRADDSETNSGRVRGEGGSEMSTPVA
ncbi:hypothetical protein DFH08DRAFT_858410 [Mycena albidolilacea]|uniref:GATA-type domain-containing protein n=1 Tax=Mycena albidolilacea TaxID=1033008 RepID=A0AAD7A8Q1_9AGAR|nr:hypothetical protein DFH08DRAFT_858410 [Mycena albidolilacea]